MADSGNAPASTFVERSPAPALAGVASAAWVQRVADGGEPYAHRNIPNGSVELQCVAGAMPRVIGPGTGPQVDLLAPGTTVVGLRLAPGAAQAVLGVPASAVVDTQLGADEVWGGATVALAERVAGASSPEAALAALEAHVAERVDGPVSLDPLAAEAVHRLRWGTEPVAALTAELFVSERQLRRRLETAIGLSPKTLQRVLRFQRFLALAQYASARGRELGDDGLARVAAETGYADQSHLARECRRLTGESPSAFLAHVARTCACGHDHAASFEPLLQARPRP